MEIKDEQKIKKKKADKLSRSKDSVFRITLRNQVRLIEIADSKANIVIGINSLILASIVTFMSSRLLYSAEEGLFENRIFAIPILIIILACLVSDVFAIMAAKPKIIRPKSNTANNIQEQVSLMFFESFYNKSQKDFMLEFGELLENSKDIYDQFTIDVHNQGRVLHRKYRLVSIAYTIFMYGFILGVLGFLFIWLLL